MTIGLCACSHHGRGGNGGTGGMGLNIVPANATVDITGGSPATLAFQLIDNGDDVTSHAVFSVDNGTLGSFSGATFTAYGSAAGVTTIHGAVNGQSTSTSLTVRMKQIVIAPGAPADAPSKFSGPPDLSIAPAMVYPPDGVLIPPNLNELEVQFTRAPSTQLFEIGFSSPALDLLIYAPCTPVGNGCGFLPDDPTWQLLAHAATSQTVTLSLRATDGAGGPVGVAAPRQLSFADEELQGGLYYWAAASGAIYRYDFGLRGQKAENFYTPQSAGATCVGCHALSRDGSRIAVGLNVPGPATLRLLDVATRKTLYESAGGPGFSGGSNFETLSPDGTAVLTNSGADLALHDSATGNPLGSSPAITNGTMPDWSADGMNVVFARPAASLCPIPNFCGSQPGVDGASLFLSAVNGMSFGAPTQLVPGGATNNYYPSFSPDGAFVAFNRSNGNSYDAPDARVLVVPTTGGAQPVDLGAVNTQQGNSWPKFAPFVQHFQGKTIFWLTFSSRRDYGLRLLNSASGSPVAQIWMVAVSPDRLMVNETGGTDAGYPPFWLPFQDISTGNHIAQWTQKVARQPCGGPDGVSQCMPDETCMNNECVPTPIQ
jgi:hypothetical protein